ncbi:hypothetical protein D3C71_1915540 [compost metagenome]
MPVLDFIVGGHAELPAVQHVQILAFRWRFAVDTGDRTLAVGAIDNFKRLAGHCIAHLDGFAHHIGLQLFVGQRLGAFGFQLINGFAPGHRLGVLRVRRVPDG